MPFETNRGLGLALRDGIKACSNELIARMDTDDISRSDRFEIQLKIFEDNPDIDICGSHIIEFDSSPDNILAERRVPLANEDIRKYQKKRDGFNHVTVMYKKEAVLKASNYQDCQMMEDSLLWTNMFLSGARGLNCDDYLVYVRTGGDMFERRDSYAYYKRYRAGRRRLLETGFISRWDYIYTLAVQFVIALMPNGFRGWVYNELLRSNVKGVNAAK